MAARSSMMRSFAISWFEPDALEVEVHQLAFFLRRQIADVHHDGEAIGRGFGERKRALTELHRIHRRDREAEGGQLVGRLADASRCGPEGLRETRSVT